MSFTAPLARPIIWSLTKFSMLGLIAKQTAFRGSEPNALECHCNLVSGSKISSWHEKLGMAALGVAGSAN